MCSATAVLLAFGLFDFRLATLATFLLGVQWAVDWPTRRALIPDLVGRELTVNAVALEAVSMNLTRIVGPLMAGALVAYVSAAAAFGVMVGAVRGGDRAAEADAAGGRATAGAGGSMLRYLARGSSAAREPGDRRRRADLASS